MFASSIFGTATVALAVFAIAGPGALIVAVLGIAVLGISTLPGSTSANAILGVTVASGALTGVGGTAASSDDEGVSLIILCLPMEDPQCGGELDPMAGTNPLPFGFLAPFARTAPARPALSG